MTSAACETDHRPRPPRNGASPARIRFLVVLVLCATGCQSTREVGQDDPPLPDFDTSAFPDAIRLTNGTVSLVVIPSIGGRIMRYGFVGRPNVLWNNPKIADRPTTRSTYI